VILVVVEHSNGALSKSALELFAAAQQSGALGPITALVLGSSVDQIASETALYVEQVLVADLPELSSYDPEIWSAAAAQIAYEGEAKLVLIGGSRSGREYSPRVAVKLDAALLEDVTSLRATENGAHAEHYTYLSRVTEKTEATAEVVVATVKPGSFEPARKRGEPGDQFDVDLNLPPRRLEVTGAVTEKSSRIALEEADIVVAGGRGLGSPEDFGRLVEGLADRLGAAVGATRAVVDAGWRPYTEQVGQTGKTVQPQLYVGLGISGAVQHLSGMNKSKLIVAINKDADAPIFSIADFGIVGDVGQIIPALIEQLQTP
jgi:electron transfer flavoprotein alpha subunit